MKAWLGCLLLGMLSADGAEVHSWSDGKGGQIEAEYLNSTAQTVTIKRVPDGQVFRLMLKDCSEADRAYVAQLEAAAKEASMIEVPIRGEVVWRLPGWQSLSWSNQQNSEIWTWDEAAGKPAQKVATIAVNYESSSKHNEFEGKFASTGAVRIPKEGKLVIRGIFNASVNGKTKSLDEYSQPVPIPAAGKDGIDLRTVRFSLNH